MGESVECGNPVQLSVSFGKYESDALSWEKWSSFSPNKYLEEVGSLSTPGSVAQKKAYFEAHYKKIAAQKAILEAENAIEIGPSISDNNQDIADQTNKASIVSAEEIPFTGVQIDTNAEIVQSSNVISNDKPKEDDFVAVTCENSLEVTKEQIVLVEDDTHRNEPLKPEHVEVNLKIDAHSRRNEKVITNKKEQNLAETRMNKKPVSTISKSATNSTRNLPKPETKSKLTLISPSRPSAEKSGVSLMPTKNATAGKSTLYMSLNLDPSNDSSDPPSHSTTRKSVFMEKMGDKDIVKRVFKTFQNDFNQLRSSGDEYSAVHKQPLGNVPRKGKEQKVSPSTAFRKENERMRHIEEKMNSQRGRLGTTWNSVSARSLNEAGLGGIKPKVSPSSTGSRSAGRTEKHKEFDKKVEEKSYAKETETTRLRLKSKEEKKLEVNRVRQSLNFKAKPLPDFYRSLNISSERVVVKSGICRRPQAA